MNRVFNVLSGIGIIIVIYLFLANSKATTSIISTLATNTTAGIKTLQGRG